MTNSDLSVTAGGEPQPSASTSTITIPNSTEIIKANAILPLTNSTTTIIEPTPTTSNGLPSSSTSPITTSVHTTPVSVDPKKKLVPDECLQAGIWEVELVYYTLGHRSIPNGLGNGDNRKQRRGKVYKCLTDNEFKCFESHDGTIYWPGDFVYVETSASEPYMIGNISGFKRQVSFKQANLHTSL